jgi:hypothetical protein
MNATFLSTFRRKTVKTDLAVGSDRDSEDGKKKKVDPGFRGQSLVF